MFVVFCVNWEDGDGDILIVVLEGDLWCSEVGILGCDDRILGKYGMIWRVFKFFMFLCGFRLLVDFFIYFYLFRGLLSFIYEFVRYIFLVID